MTQITAKMVKELRDKTNAGMMDCKKALAECERDIEKAIDWLRQKGLMSARKREGRSTKEGLVITAISNDCKKASILEMNSETDFVAKNEAFQNVANDIAQFILDSDKEFSSVDELLEQSTTDGKISDAITNLVATIGENINLRRFQVLKADTNSFLHTYIHGEGKIGVVIQMLAENTNDETDALAHDIALHVAASNPMVLTADAVPSDFVAREKALYESKAAESGKPENVQAKIVEGNIKKLYSEVVLLEQAFIKDPSKSISEMLKDASKSLGKVDITNYVRFQLGEEVAGEKTDIE